MVLKGRIFVAALIWLGLSCNNDVSISIKDGGTALATIENLPIMSEEEHIFFLKSDRQVRIYAVGEESIDMVSVDPIYLYKPDAIELYIEQKNKESTHLYFPLQDSFGKSSTVAYNIKRVGLTASYDTLQSLYMAKLSIPLKYTSTVGEPNEKIRINILLADNDDRLKQKAKLAWAGNTDPLLTGKTTYGEIILDEEQENTFNNSNTVLLHSRYRSSKRVEKSNLPTVGINGFVFGRINKAEDFSAKMSSEWDKDSLYLYLTILDNTSGRINPKTITRLSNFHDWGWIEDNHGNVIWTMTNIQTKHAGGALKNRKIDTTVFLKKGSYKLKYSTDESHSWDNWDDEAPDLPFYGIMLFENHTRH